MAGTFNQSLQCTQDVFVGFQAPSPPVSSVALSYALHGANGRRATWAKHSRNDPSIESMISDYSVVRLSRPGLDDKMLDSEFDHGAPLSAISASPNQSFDSGLYNEYQHQEHTAFDSIMVSLAIR